MDRHGLTALLFLTLSLFMTGTGTAAAQPDDSRCMGTGEPGGQYHAFAETLSALLGDAMPCVDVTAGSTENLEGLRSGEFDFVIAQNDLAHHLFFGDSGFEQNREFSAVAPLFPEYVQVFVRRDAGAPLLLGDLRGAAVNIGAPGSGSYRNARDVLATAGLREGVDYRPTGFPMQTAFQALRAETIDAMIVTAAGNLDFDAQAFQRLALPASLIDTLATDNAYYDAGEQVIGDVVVPTLEVRAFLFARNDAPDGAVARLMDGLLTHWDDLTPDVPGLAEPETFLRRSPLPYHPEARRALVDAGHANPEPAYWMWIVIWLAILTSSFAAVTFQSSYDRTGVRRERRGRFAGLQTALDLWARPSPWVIGVSLFALTLLLALLALRSAEAGYARDLNLDNPFADFTLSEGFIWMLTFVASGFTENDAYPLSVMGRLLVAILAFVGVSGPIAAIIIIVNLWGRKRAESLAGLADTRWHDHVLVCGWNESLDGVVFAMTGTDAEKLKKVCIVAESGDASPLADHRFDQARVNFRRGDSADRETLERAGAQNASHAIILADYERRKTRNIGAVLTAMNLKRLNPNIHISAELAFSQNADHFAAFGCTTLITPDIFVAKAAALSTIHPFMIDYLLDVLTYDGFDELFSIDFDELCELNPDIEAGMDSGEMERVLWKSGANLIGLVQGDLQRGAVFDAEVIDGGPIISYTRKAGYGHKPAPNDRIIYSANKRTSIRRDRGHHDVHEADPIPRSKFRMTRPEGTAILLYASRAHLERLSDNLKAFHINPVIHSIAIEDEPFLTAERLAERLPADLKFQHVIILANAAAKREAADAATVRAVDAATLLATKLIREYANTCGWDCSIISEVLAREDREAFLGPQAARLTGQDNPDEHDGAGATVVIPSATLVERFLVKDVFDGNAMLDFLIAVMNMRDGTHLYIHEVTSEDYLLGEAYASLVKTRLPGLHLVGWLPVSKREELRNRAGDFNFHFRTSFDSRIEQTEIREGDLLVFTACFKIWEEGDRSEASQDS
ncbi:MAG: hypothetical protein CMF75_02490 [Maricaulis sp.]|nr:hypothetical protein [Maricaulis sp.]